MNLFKKPTDPLFDILPTRLLPQYQSVIEPGKEIKMGSKQAKRGLTFREAIITTLRSREGMIIVGLFLAIVGFLAYFGLTQQWIGFAIVSLLLIVWLTVVSFIAIFSYALARIVWMFWGWFFPPMLYPTNHVGDN